MITLIPLANLYFLEPRFCRLRFSLELWRNLYFMNLLLGTLTFLISLTCFSQVGDTTETDQKLFTSVEKLPEFPGGNEQFTNYIRLFLHNTEMSIGRIVVEFVVETDGALTEIKISKGLCPQCDAEALRVMRNSPKWIPGEHNGKKVRVKYRATIIY